MDCEPQKPIERSERAYNVRITTQQRWLIRSSWPGLEFYVSTRGFGEFATLKELIGAPTGSKDDHRDYDSTDVQASKGLISGEFRKLASEISPQHRLTVIFYDHLFLNNPQMKEIFWRFNLWQTMTKIAAVMDPNLDLHKAIKALAERHRGRGIQNEDYDKIGRSFVWSLYEFKRQAEEEKMQQNSSHQKNQKPQVQQSHPQPDSQSHSQSPDSQYQPQPSLQLQKQNFPNEILSEKVVQAWSCAWDLFADAMKVNDDEESEVQNKFQEMSIGHGKKGSETENPTLQENLSGEQKSSQQEVKVFTMEEVSKHNFALDLWLVVEDKVYDLTKFLPRHPGGEMMLLGAGKDATQLFLKNFHSKRAQEILSKYFIGDVKKI